MNRQYRIRFHLQRGSYYMHWQIRNTKDNSVTFFDPDKVSIHMTNCKLINKVAIAKRIHTGSEKNVCAYVECSSYEVTEPDFDYVDQFRVEYNPQVTPHWRQYPCIVDENADGYEFDAMFTFGSVVYY